MKAHKYAGTEREIVATRIYTSQIRFRSVTLICIFSTTSGGKVESVIFGNFGRYFDFMMHHYLLLNGDLQIDEPINYPTISPKVV